MVDASILIKQLEDLNKVVGTDLVDKYKAKINLPKGWYLDFQLHSNKFVVVNHMGAKVFD